MKNRPVRGPPPTLQPMDAAAVRKARSAPKRSTPPPSAPAPAPDGPAEVTDTYGVSAKTGSHAVGDESSAASPAFRPRLSNLAKDRIKRQFPHLAAPYTNAEAWIERRRKRRGARGSAHRERTKRAVSTALYVLEAMKGGFDFGDALDIAIAYQGIGPEEMQSIGLYKILAGGFTVSKFLRRKDSVAWEELAAEVERRVLMELPRFVEQEVVSEKIHSVNLDGRRASFLLDEDDPRY